MDSDFIEVSTDLSECDTQADSRCRVIKILQQQIKELMLNRNDYDHQKSRAQIAEQALQMKEAEYKLQFDDIEYELLEVKKENQALKNQLLQTQKNKQQIKEIFNEDADIPTSKWKKWKTKYHALSKSDPTFDAIAKTISLESKLESAKQELEAEKQNVQDQKDQYSSLQLKNNQLFEETKKLRAQANDATTRANNLEKTVAQLRDEKKKLETQADQKSKLLQNTRKKQEATLKAKQSTEMSTMTNMDKLKKANLEQQAQIVRLEETLKRERKQKKKLTKQLNQMKDINDSTSEQSQAEIDRLEKEKLELKRKIEESESTSSTFEAELNDLKDKTHSLEDEVKKSEKLKNKNAKLTSAVSIMKSKIDKLKDEISSSESSMEVRSSDLRSLLAKHYAGIDPSADWEDLLQFVEKLINNLKKSDEDRIELKKQLKKAQKTGETVNQEKQKHTEENQKKLIKLQQQLKEAQEKSDQMEQVNDTAGFRHSIIKKIDQSNNNLCKSINEMLAMLNEDERPRTTMRSVILATFFTIRWSHYQKSQPYDGSTILEIATPIPANISTPIQQLNILVTDLHSRFQTLQESSDSKSSENQDLSEKVSKLKTNLKIAKDQIAKLTNQNKDLNREYKDLVEKSNNLIDATEFRQLEKKHQKKLEEYKILEKQFVDVKLELKRVITTVDAKQQDFAEIQSQQDEIIYENEELRLKITQLEHELELTQAALKDKTREILALERRLMKQQTQFVVVKDTLPNPVPQQQETKSSDTPCDSFYANDAIRNGLAVMQSRFMKRDNLV